MNKAKPRIRKVTPFLFGIPCRPIYVCESSECVEFGETAKEAYENWFRAAPTTRIGMWWARLMNYVSDYFFC